LRHYANLAKLGHNGEPPTFRTMLMMCQKFKAALEDADSSTDDSTSTDKQVMRQLQRKEFDSFIFTERAILGTLNDNVADGNGMHVAYIQMMCIVVSCFLVVLPWGRCDEYGGIRFFSLLKYLWAWEVCFFLGWS
jgi:hypothetical protein